MATTTTTNLSAIGNTLSTASPAQIASPTPISAPTINTSTPSPTKTNTTTNTTGSAPVLTSDQLNAIAKGSGFQGGSFSSTGLPTTPAQQIADRYKAGLTNVQNSGASAPDSQGDAMAGVKDNVPPPQTEPEPAKPDPVANTLKNDPGYQQLLKDQQEYLSTVNQQKSLVQQYQDLSGQLGLPALNTQLLNMKAVIDGSEQDIRNEITKVGGFATESQVQALTVARNKLLIQNYNNLLQTRDNAQTQLTTISGLAKEDQANATSKINEQLNFDKQIMDYEQKFQDNAKSGYQKIIEAPGYGYKALYASTGGDPTTVAMVEKTLGLPSGSLKQLGEQNATTWSDPYSLGGNLVQKNNLTGEIRTAVANAGTGGSNDPASLVTLPGDPTSQSILAHTGLSVAAFAYATQGSSALTRMSSQQRLQFMNEWATWAKKNNVDTATFQSQYQAYNDALQSNVKRVNNVKVAEGELTGTLTNLATAADEASFKSMKWENVTKLFAGQEFNDANVSKYAFHLNQLRSELALYNSAAAGKTFADQADQAEAERIIKDGFAKGSIKGFQDALKASVDKMDKVLQQNVERTNGQVWNLFGVTKPTLPQGTPQDTQRVNDLLSQHGYSYDDLLAKMMTPGALKEGQYPAIDAQTGQPYGATKDEIKSGKYIAL